MNTNKRKAIVGAKVVLETGIIWDGVILLENEKIRNRVNLAQGLLDIWHNVCDTLIDFNEGGQQLCRK